jgi:SAM-dependent methyltransferase
MNEKEDQRIFAKYNLDNLDIKEILDWSPYAHFMYEAGKDDLSALDVGYGTGPHLIYLLSKGFRVIGIEKNGEQQKTVQKGLEQLEISEHTKAKLKLIEGDFESYEFDNKDLFSIIILSNFLHFYSKKQWETIIEKCYRLLKLNGVVYICGHHIDHPEPPYKNADRISDSDIDNLKSSFGLKEVFRRKTSRKISMEEKRENDKMFKEIGLKLDRKTDSYIKIEFILKKIDKSIPT